LIRFLEWWKSYNPKLAYAELSGDDLKKNCTLANYQKLKLYIQPGGNAYEQQLRLAAEGKANISNFIDRGGAYLGICAGFYYAARAYYWQGARYAWPHLLGRFPEVEGSITDIADYDKAPGYRMTGVSGGLSMLYWGGPTLGLKHTPPNNTGIVLLHLTDLPSQLPAAIQYNNMLLLSTHPEAYENTGFSGLTPAQRVQNYRWLASAINGVAGTQWLLPPSATPDGEVLLEPSFEALNTGDAGEPSTSTEPPYSTDITNTDASMSSESTTQRLDGYTEILDIHAAGADLSHENAHTTDPIKTDRHTSDLDPYSEQDDQHSRQKLGCNCQKSGLQGLIGMGFILVLLFIQTRRYRAIRPLSPQADRLV
jgi:hypothetical protein